MSGFSVANNITLRSYYATYRAFTTKSTRSSATTNQLNYADAQALRRAVQKLDDFDFETADKDDISSHVRAFIDTYNYTMDSAKSSTNSYATSTYKNLKNLASKYSKDLENIGIKENSSGYLTLSSSAVENIRGSRFKSLLNKDSKFMKQLTTYAKRMATNIDYYA